MSKSKKPNKSFVHQFLDLYSNKGAGFAMLLLYKHYLVKGNAGINDVMPSLRKEAIRRKLDMEKLFKELTDAVGTIDGVGELRADSSNEADQPKNENGRSETRADDGSSRPREEGKT
jgi:hypothetical protein